MHVAKLLSIRQDPGATAGKALEGKLEGDGLHVADPLEVVLVVSQD